MTTKLRWGILATGWIADYFVKDLQLTGREVAAVGSRSLEGAQKFAARFGIKRAHGSYQALCEDPNVDVIYVATPHPMHADNAQMALEAGKHVLVEKAFTLNAREARRIVDLAKRNNLVILEAMWTRFLPHMGRIRELVRSGALGEVYSVTADHARDLPSDPAHRLNDIALGGGALLDLGIYPISFAFDVLGPPKDIMAMARFQAGGADAEVATMFRHASGAISTTLSALDNNGPNVALVLGTKARIEVDAVFYTPTSFRLIGSDGGLIEKFQSNVAGRGMQFQAVELERLAAAGKTSGDILPPEESVAIMEALDSVRERIGLRYPGET